MSCSSGPPVPNPEVCVLETPKVNPADALMPGLLKLKPEVLDVPNPEKQRFKSLRSKYFKFSQQACHLNKPCTFYMQHLLLSSMMLMHSGGKGYYN